MNPLRDEPAVEIIEGEEIIVDDKQYAGKMNDLLATLRLQCWFCGTHKQK